MYFRKHQYKIGCKIFAVEKYHLGRECRIKNKSFYSKILNSKKFDLIINCDGNNQISRNFFYNRINKSYNSYSYTTIIKHQKINNVKAIQVFTKIGPIAFLPISAFETSI